MLKPGIFSRLRRWFDKHILLRPGIHFSCTRCGDCCTRPGSVYYTSGEVRQAAEYLDMDVALFKQRYISNRVGAVHESYTKDRCPLYKDGVGCTIYPVRPLQCSTYPFWEGNFRNEATIRRLERDCRGMGRGQFYSFKEVKRRVAEAREKARF